MGLDEMSAFYSGPRKQGVSGRAPAFKGGPTLYVLDRAQIESVFETGLL